ncbi:MAG: 23S rRNA (adenine(2503)-C(2))-methyltransferase RlmN [Phycisphaerales bacterium]|nr:23S rRNA (adenine(2503)-C(2))-methyltransferase RlmN [Planctomycetota bacterium]MCH8507307.1 23S rRNA (adenine(2503)-C(2))-methyltransferase RlmN [Phycisphaerales bacterium]
MEHPRHHIFDFTPETLADWSQERGLPKYRAKQVLEWVYAKGVADPVAMSNLSRSDRETLAREMTFLSGPAVAHQVATDGTQKLLIEWIDGLEGAAVPASEATVDHGTRLPILGSDGRPGAMPYSNTERQTECVMIPFDGEEDGSASRATEDDRPEGGRSKSRRTACISSQVGCPVGCKFCATGIGGLDGNLSAGRIVEQVWRLARLEGVGRISNVVFMGMGEPLANFRPVVHAVRTLAAPWGMGIGARKITVSTVGMHKAIEKLADELDLPITLALSLHAPNDELRRKLIPWAEFTTIEQLVAACRKWFEKTGREITLEYILLAGVNDRPEHAAELAGVCRRLRANVNLIRYNEVLGLPFERPQTPDVLAFQQVLRERGINCHIRASRGRDIAAACGQLRHEQAV